MQITLRHLMNEGFKVFNLILTLPQFRYHRLTAFLSKISQITFVFTIF